MKTSVRSCKSCAYARWTWVERTVDDRRYINVNHTGLCTAECDTAASIGEGLKFPLNPRAPLERCRAWTAARECVLA